MVLMALLFQWGSTIKLSWVCIVTSQYPPRYGFRFFQDLKLLQPTVLTGNELVRTLPSGGCCWVLVCIHITCLVLSFTLVPAWWACFDWWLHGYIWGARGILQMRSISPRVGLEPMFLPLRPIYAPWCNRPTHCACSMPSGKVSAPHYSYNWDYVSAESVLVGFFGAGYWTSHTAGVGCFGNVIIGQDVGLDNIVCVLTRLFLGVLFFFGRVEPMPYK